LRLPQDKNRNNHVKKKLLAETVRHRPRAVSESHLEKEAKPENVVTMGKTGTGDRRDEDVTALGAGGSTKVKTNRPLYSHAE